MRRALVLIVVAIGAVVAGGLWLILAVTEIAPGVTLIRPRLESLGANMLVHTGPAGRVVVDSQLPLLAPLVAFRVGQLNAQDRIVITHWHPDHSGGYAQMAAPDMVWTHPHTRRTLAAAQTGHHLTAPGSRHEFPARPQAQLPAGEIDADGYIGDAQVLVFAAAHTAADLVVVFSGSNVIAVGDLIWPGSFPFVDIHSGGSVAGLLAALDKVLAHSNANTIIVPGHGLPMSRAKVFAYRTMVADSAQAVLCAADAAQKPAQLAPWHDWASDLLPVQRWVEIVDHGRTGLQCQQVGIEPGRHPQAPPQVQQFEFLLGEHRCEDVFTELDGSQQRLRSRWVGQYVLNGFGIQDHYTNAEFSATNIRTYNVAEDRWQVSYFREPGDISGTWEGQGSSSGAVLQRTFDFQGQPALSRLVFSVQHDNRFTWRSEYVSGDQRFVDWRSDCVRVDG